jgi:hypothetical protein
MQVSSPAVSATLYTWGQGRVTAEGEYIPVRVDSLYFSYPTRLELLLPNTLEHVIDEASPLYGHTHRSLVARC